MTGWLAVVERTGSPMEAGMDIVAEKTSDAGIEGFFGVAGIQDGFSDQPDSGFQVWPAASPEKSGARNRESLVIISGKSGT